ncbi:Protein of unknown function [Pyronema omphalodes CBS 100304]|uniref:Uncharacterized protein n=1 Tax=Pyronema omphalodes (strain CBS 100304) TaxID=1076935 RepID=U4LEP6_PYROM|nr:Protein of unknown function [Pyronema omphalodes CBS 100304]
MQLDLLLISLISALIASSAAQDTTVYNKYILTVHPRLNGVIYSNLMFVNGSAYVGNIKYHDYSEPLLRGLPPPLELPVANRPDFEAM